GTSTSPRGSRSVRDAMNYYGPMLPSFFESVLQLIVRTSTDLPPDVRAAMKTSLVSEPAGTRSSQALTIIAQNIDLAVDNEGAIGVCVGGDRTSGYTHAKEQLFRTLDDVNPDARLAELEASIMATVNDLEIGTMGFGGKVTLIGCKIGALNRLPASFFVSVAYDCWAFRRLGVELNASTGYIDRWLYRDPSHPIIPMLDQAGFTRTGREVTLQTPLTEDAVRSLKVGDVVLVSGRMFTGRDAVHSYLMKHEPPVDLRGSVLYHCGPVVVKEGEGWRVTAAGPTTSIREEPYQGEIIKRYGVRVVIGKGGMGAKTLAAMQEHGAVYLNAIGGAAQFYARSIKSVDGVSLLDFGTPEAMWHLTVEEFPAIVTMDAHGNSLHKDI